MDSWLIMSPLILQFSFTGLFVVPSNCRGRSCGSAHRDQFVPVGTRHGSGLVMCRLKTLNVSPMNVTSILHVRANYIRGDHSRNSSRKWSFSVRNYSRNTRSLHFLRNARVCIPLSFCRNLALLTIVQDCAILKHSNAPCSYLGNVKQM